MVALTPSVPDAVGRSRLSRRLLQLPAELGDRPLLELAVDEQVDLLVVEGDQPGDLLALGQGRAVGPGQVLDQAIADPDRPVLGLALVAAGRSRRAPGHW